MAASRGLWLACRGRQLAEIASTYVSRDRKSTAAVQATQTSSTMTLPTRGAGGRFIAAVIGRPGAQGSAIAGLLQALFDRLRRTLNPSPIDPAAYHHHFLARHTGVCPFSINFEGSLWSVRVPASRLHRSKSMPNLRGKSAERFDTGTSTMVGYSERGGGKHE